MIPISVQSLRAPLLLDRAGIRSLATEADYLQAVESAFRAAHDGQAVSPPPLHLPATDGGFHAKGALIRSGRTYAAIKINGNFPGNRDRHGLPTIQGVVVLCDGETGQLLSVMDSIEITLRRTAATTALAARHLAKPDSTVLAICGCGDQGRAQAEALAALFPIKRVAAWDIAPDRAQDFAEGTAAAPGLPVTALSTLDQAVLDADIIVTCTTARRPFLGTEHVSPGAFVAAVGADNTDKSEIAPDLMSSAKIVVDSLQQCLAMGDLHHAISAGVMSAGDVYAELAEIVAGARPGRSSPDEIFIFDSTGTALQDVASAAVIFERAVAKTFGTSFRFM